MSDEWIAFLVLSNIAQLLLVLFLPFRVRAALRLVPAGGRAELTVQFALFKITFHYRVNLLQRPVLTIFRLRADGGLTPAYPRKRRKPKRRRLFDDITFPDVMRRVCVKALNAELCIGLGDAAATAAAAGALSNAISEARKAEILPLPGAARVAVVPDFASARLILEGECMLSASIVKIIPIFMNKKGDKQHAASD